MISAHFVTCDFAVEYLRRHIRVCNRAVVTLQWSGTDFETEPILIWHLPGIEAREVNALRLDVLMGFVLYACLKLSGPSSST